MTTLAVFSDLHIGPSDSPHRFFRGENDLAAAMLDLAVTHGAALHLVLNGDTFDFLMATQRLEFDHDAVLAALEAILSGPDGQSLVKGLGAVLGRGGSVTLRMGNHDPELKDPGVQERLIRAVCDAVGRPVSLRFDDMPAASVDVGGITVSIAHGEAEDPFNKFDYERAATPSFTYPPGSRIVVSFLQRARQQYGLGFLDALKPDFHGAVLAGVLVRPSALALLGSVETARLVRDLLRWGAGGPLGIVSGPEGETVDLTSIYRLLDDGGALGLIADDEPGATRMLDAAAASVWRSVAEHVIPRVRRAVREGGADYFNFTPDLEELDLVLNTFQFGARVVIEGHTHAARFWTDQHRVYVNTGTWGALMKLPPVEADAAEWVAFYERLKANPTLTEETTERVFTAALVRELPNGAAVELVRWRDGAWHLAGSSSSRIDLEAGMAGTARGLWALAPIGGALVVAGDTATESQHEWRRRLASSRPLAVPRHAVQAALKRMEVELQPTGSVQAAGALADLLRNLEEQRRNPEHLDILHVADAICQEAYDRVIDAARLRGWLGLGDKEPVRPVAWIQSVVSPLTWTRGAFAPAPGLDLGGSINLPFQIVLVPTDHIDRPWRLVSVLHEVGHGLDHALKLSRRMEAWHPSPQWARWMGETVADVLALGLGGAAYLRGLEWIVRGLRSGRLEADGGPDHPPTLLRLALLEQLGGEPHVHLEAARADPTLRERLREADGLLSGLREIIALTERRSTGFCELPASLLDPSDWAGAEPGPSAKAREGLRSYLRRTPRPEGALSPPQVSFLQGQATRFAPASIDATGSLRKRPRVDLMLDHDHMAFVGAVHWDLLKTLQEARKQRGRPWQTIEVYFVGVDADLPSLYPARAGEDLADAREALRVALAAGLRDEDLAASWRISQICSGSLFGSFYLKRDPRYPDAWYVHSSAPVWGTGISAAPSTDYQSVSGDLTGDPEIRALLEGLVWLRRESGVFAEHGSGDGPWRT